jgi:hypothetical protein
VPRGRHHRCHLLDHERVVVAPRARGLAGEVLAEELELLAERAMQRDLAEGPPAGRHPALELVGLGGGDRYREACSEQGWATRGLQIAEQVACGLGALVALVAGPLVAVVLGAQDLIGVLDAPAHQPHGRAVR